MHHGRECHLHVDPQVDLLCRPPRHIPYPGWSGHHRSRYCRALVEARSRSRRNHEYGLKGVVALSLKICIEAIKITYGVIASAVSASNFNTVFPLSKSS